MCNVPHLALGGGGIAAVLVWRMPEFAVVLFSGTEDFAGVQDRGMVESGMVLRLAKRRAVKAGGSGKIGSTWDESVGLQIG